MRIHHGGVRSALTRTLEPPERRRRFEVKPWGTLAWLLVALAAAVARC